MPSVRWKSAVAYKFRSGKRRDYESAGLAYVGCSSNEHGKEHGSLLRYVKPQAPPQEIVVVPPEWAED